MSPNGQEDLSPLAAASAASASVVAYTTPWLHRRVEKVSYKSEPVIRRSISIDFTIPDGLESFYELPNGEFIYYVPLSLLRKWPPLLNLDLRSEAGLSVPLLTTDKNREVDSAVLVALAPDGELKNEVADDLAKIPLEDPATSRQLFDSVAKRVIAAKDKLGEDESDWVQTLVLAGDLVSNSILWFRTRAYPNKRQVVKIGFDQAVRPVAGGRAFLASLGWIPYRELFSIPHLGDGGSYHLQFEPPDGMVVQNANFKVLSPWDDLPEPKAAPIRTQIWEALRRGIYAKWEQLFGQLPDQAEERRLPEMTHREDAPSGEPFIWNSRDRAYLYISGRRKHFGAAKFDLAVHTKAFPTAALLAGLFIAVLLTVFAAAASSVAEPKQLGTAVTILLLVPGLLGYLVIRPNEHPLVASRLAGIRRTVLLAGALPVIAAVVLLVERGHDTDALCIWWTALSAIAWVATLVLTLSWLLPGPAYREEA